MTASVCVSRRVYRSPVAPRRAMARPQRRAWTASPSRVHLVQAQFGGARGWLRPGALYGAADLIGDLGVHRCKLGQARTPLQESIREQVQWILDVLRLRSEPIRLRVARPVAAPPPGPGLDQRRPAAGTRRATASRSATRTDSTSLPSTLTPGMP